MNQSRTSTFLFALATLTSISCASAAEAQIGAAVPVAQRQSFPIPSSDCQPISITLGPDGNFWFTEQDRSQVARITPDGGDH
jgi:streptogramin lyase